MPDCSTCAIDAAAAHAMMPGIWKATSFAPSTVRSSSSVEPSLCVIALRPLLHHCSPLHACVVALYRAPTLALSCYDPTLSSSRTFGMTRYGEVKAGHIPLLSLPNCLAIPPSFSWSRSLVTLWLRLYRLLANMGVAFGSNASVTATGILFPILGAVFIALRFYSRRLHKAPLGFDDWLCLPAWVGVHRLQVSWMG